MDSFGEDYSLIEGPDGRRINYRSPSELSKIDEEKVDLIEQLRKEALALHPKHGDKLYPLEVLGVYNRVLKQKIISFEISNPEVFIDDRIKNWIITADKRKFTNRLERELTQNTITRDLFLLRLNYAYLLEEGQDEINVHRRQVGSLTFTDSLDAEGNYTGPLGSAFDIDIEQLDAMAGKFYADKRNMKKMKTGTKQSIRDAIITRLSQMGYNINTDLNDVYHTLNLHSADHLEEGLLARIAYLVFISEVNDTANIQGTAKIKNTSRIEGEANDLVPMYCKHCGTKFTGNPEDTFCSPLCEKMFEKFSKR